MCSACDGGLTNVQQQEKACLPGTACWQNLPDDLQEAKRQQALLQRQNQLSAEQSHTHARRVVRPMTSY
jgi:hypothetical protein